MKIIADAQIPFLNGVLEPFADIKYLQGHSIKKRDIYNADALIVRTRTHCEKNLLAGTSVKLIATTTIGTNHLDIPWLENEGIKWRNAPGCNSESVYQYIASILALLINDGLNPEKATIGIVGVGMIGSKIEKLAKTLGFNVLLNDPPRERKEQQNNSSLVPILPFSSKFSNYNTILEVSDIVIFCTTLTFEGTDATYHLFDYKDIETIKKGSIIINASRGEVINEDALLKGIDMGKISKVALDVWENEPDISTELLNKVWIATPHIAGFSVEGKANGTIMAVREVSSFFDLGLDNWEPKSVPIPECTTIKIDKSNKKPYQIAAAAILKTYNVTTDDARFRANPAEFEKQRDNYPIRREFDAWTVEISEDNNCLEMLENIGFTINKY